MYHNFIQGCSKGGPGPPNGPKGHMSAQSHQGSETEMRGFFVGTEGKIAFPKRGHSFALKANQKFSGTPDI